jgi:hypothetical protein
MPHTEIQENILMERRCAAIPLSLESDSPLAATIVGKNEY